MNVTGFGDWQMNGDWQGWQMDVDFRNDTPEIVLMRVVDVLEKRETVNLSQEDRKRVLNLLGRSHGSADNR